MRASMIFNSDACAYSRLLALESLLWTWVTRYFSSLLAGISERSQRKSKECGARTGHIWQRHFINISNAERTCRCPQQEQRANDRWCQLSLWYLLVQRGSGKGLWWWGTVTVCATGTSPHVHSIHFEVFKTLPVTSQDFYPCLCVVSGFCKMTRPFLFFYVYWLIGVNWQLL